MKSSMESDDGVLVCSACDKVVADVCCLPTDMDLNLCDACLNEVLLWAVSVHRLRTLRAGSDVKAYSLACRDAIRKCSDELDRQYGEPPYPGPTKQSLD